MFTKHKKLPCYKKWHTGFLRTGGAIYGAVGKIAKRATLVALAAMLLVSPIATSSVPVQASPADDITALGVSASPSSFRTFLIPPAGPSAEDLIVSISITLSNTYSGGGYIELPLNYTPNSATHPAFDTCGGSTMLLPFFIPQEQGLNDLVDDTTSIISSYDIDASKITLYIDNSANAGSYTITLRFTFEDDYLSQIPPNTIMWTVQPTAGVSGVTAKTASPATIKSSSNNGITYERTLYTPLDNNKYVGGTIAFRVNQQYFNYYESHLDLNYNNIYYVDIPDGSTVDTSASGTFLGNMNGESLGSQSPIIDYNNSGYTRYYSDITSVIPSASDWTQPAPGGISAQAYSSSAVAFNPNVALALGSQLEVHYGSDTKKINAAPVHSEGTIVYTKIDANAWQFEMNAFHGVPNNSNASSICDVTNGAIGPHDLYAFGYVNNAFTHGSVTRNVGTAPVTGVRYELYQLPYPDALERVVNFENITIIALRDSIGSPWTSYKIEFVVKDAKTLDMRTVPYSSLFTPNPNASNPNRALLTLAYNTLSGLLQMNANEYIERIIVTPMGSGGDTGLLLPNNAVGLRYKIRSWNNQVFPDGSIVPSYYLTRTAWQVFYDDLPDEERAAGYPGDYDTNADYAAYRGKQFNGIQRTHTFGNIPAAQARLISGTTTAFPGEVIQYFLQGTNNSYMDTGLWVNPWLGVRVPNILELQYGGATVGNGGVTMTNALIESGSANHADVFAKLVYSDADYNYYTFQVLDYSAPLLPGTEDPVFIIDLDFKVSGGAAAGSYAIPKVVVSASDKQNFHNFHATTIVDTTPTAGESHWGFVAGDNYLTSVIAGTASLTILSSFSLTANVSVKTSQTGGAFVKAQLLPAMPNETVQMKLTLTNSGNSRVTGIRLYNILPYNGDSLGSTGAITLAEVTSTATHMVYYTVASIVPTYGQHGSDNPDLTTFDTFEWLIAPAPGITAFFVDFNALVLEPGEHIDIIIYFDIPDASDQTAFNQFRYSYLLDDSSPINDNSPVAGFSTEAITIEYHANLPSTPHKDDVAGIPDPNSAFRGTTALGSNHDSLQIDSGAPTLSGYTFGGWYDNADCAGGIYTGGDLHQFASGENKLDLYAKWTRNQITISYDLNYTNPDSFTPAPGSTAAWFGARVGEGADGTPQYVDPGTPTRTGYNFLGWYDERGKADSNVDPWVFNTDTVEIDGTALTLYAGWGAKSVTVTFWRNHASGDGVHYDPGETLNGGKKFGETLNEPTPPLRDNYTFGGWFTTQACTNGTQWNFINDTINTEAAVQLYAKWTAQTATVTFVANDNDGGSTTADPPSMVNKPVTFDAPYGALATIARTGYTFGGWYLDAACTGSEVVNATSVTTSGNHDLYAKWTAQTATVTFVANDNDGGSTTADPPSMANKSVTFDAPYGALTTIARTGYTFGGWYLDADCFGSEVLSDTSVTTSGDHDLYAKWTVIFYNVTVYDSSATTDGSGTYIYKDTVNLDAGTKTGYTFAGWTVNSGGVTLANASAATTTFTMPDNDVEVTANWKENPPTPTTTKTGGPTIVPTTIPTTPTTVPPTSPTTAPPTVPPTSPTTVPPDTSLPPITPPTVPPTSPTTVAPTTAPTTAPPTTTTTPPTPSDDDHWALLNLILCVLGGILAIWALIKSLVKGENDIIKPLWVILAIVAGIAGIIVFFFTQDMSLPMAWVDIWTIVNLVLFVIVIIGMVLGIRRGDRDRQSSR